MYKGVASGEVRRDRYISNRKYYEKNKSKSHRSSLLYAVKLKGRIPSLASVQKYDIDIKELVCKWRAYCKDLLVDVSPVRLMKFQCLLINMI